MVLNILYHIQSYANVVNIDKHHNMITYWCQDYKSGMPQIS